MKKKIVSLLLVFCMAILLLFNGQGEYSAADEIIDLYPYGKEACAGLVDGVKCPDNASVTGSGWFMQYDNHRSWLVAGAGNHRLLSTKVVDHSGVYTAADVGGSLSYTSFGQLIYNDTKHDVQIDGGVGRFLIGSGTAPDGMGVYIDENGIIQMIEHRTNKYYIMNLGTEAAPNWIFADEASKLRYDEAVASGSALPADVDLAAIRIKLDDTKTDGYVIEPLVYASTATPTDYPFYQKNYDPTDENSKASYIIEYVEAKEVSYITLKAGWAYVAFNYLDRQLAAKVAWIDNLPYSMVKKTNSEYQKVLLDYDAKKPAFSDLADLDYDEDAPGIQATTNFREEFTLVLPNASWQKKSVNAETAAITIAEEKLDYIITVKQGDKEQEVTASWNKTTNAYQYFYNEPIEVKTNKWLSSFTVTYEASLPSSYERPKTNTVVVEYLVGGVPPKFVDVEDKVFLDEGKPVDMIRDAKAYDPEGEELEITPSYPSNFNPYNPLPGEYEITLSATIPKIVDPLKVPTLKVNGEAYSAYNPENYNDPDWRSGEASKVWIYDNNEVMALAASHDNTGAPGTPKFGVCVVIVGVDGKIREYGSGDKGTESHQVGAAAVLNMPLQEDEFCLLSYGSSSLLASKIGGLEMDPSKLLIYSTTFEIVYEIDEESIDKETLYITREKKYTIVIDDITPPVVTVVSNHYVVDSSMFDNANQAILANVIATDNYVSPSELTVYVVDKKGFDLNTPGVYSVTVAAVDKRSNKTEIKFDVIVQEPKATVNELGDLNDQIDNLTDKITELTEIIANQNAIMPIWVIVLISVGSSALAFGGALLVILLKKK